MSAVSLETVLEMVACVAGEAVDGDAPLMEAGVDSLGAIELRNQLQGVAQAGVSLPSTVVFDHPTARQLIALFAADDPVVACVDAVASGAVTAATVLSGLQALLPHAECNRDVGRLLVCSFDAISEVPA